MRTEPTVRSWRARWRAWSQRMIDRIMRRRLCLGATKIADQGGYGDVGFISPLSASSNSANYLNLLDAIMQVIRSTRIYCHGFVLIEQLTRIINQVSSSIPTIFSVPLWRTKQHFINYR